MKEKKALAVDSPKKICFCTPIFESLQERHNLLADAPQFVYGTGDIPAMGVGGRMRRVWVCGAESISQEESKYERVDGGGARWTGKGRFPP